MDSEEESMSAQEMLERIAQLDHSKSLLKEQNTEMRSWLDAADEDMAILRTENNSLRKQVKDLEKMVSDALRAKSEPTQDQPDYLHLKVRNEMQIQNLERESAYHAEENKTLAAEVRTLQQLQEQDNENLSMLKDSLQNLEFELEDAQLELQQRDEAIQQKDQALKHAEEMVADYSSIIKDLRLKYQQLKEELEAEKDEISFAIAVDLLEAKEQSSIPALSFAEELRLLDPSIHANSVSDVTQTDSEVIFEKAQQTNSLVKYTESENDNDPSDPSMPCVEEVKLQAVPFVESSKCVGILNVSQKILQLLGTLFLFFALLFITSGTFTVNSNPLSLNTFWNTARFLLEPYCTLHYGGMPPM